MEVPATLEDRLARRLTTPGGASLSDFGGIASDSLGNITGLSATVPSAPNLSGQTSYGYDTQSQLLQEQSTRLGGYTNAFAYDSAGNPTSFKGASATFNSNNQNTAYTFDGNGNPVVYKGAPMAYDAENRLTSIGGTLTAGYTGDNLRAWKQSAAGQTYFIYDGVTPIIEMDAGGNVTAVNTFGANGLVSRHTSSGSVFYAFDHQGSVSQRLDSNGTVLGSLAFDAYGSAVGTLSDPFGYEAQNGYYTDLETGLQLCTYRYYDPSAGRFLTVDPAHDGPNWYAYTDNDPINATDPMGLFHIYIEMGPDGIGFGYIIADGGEIDPPGLPYRKGDIIAVFPVSNRPAVGDPFPAGTWPIVGIRHASHFGAGAVVLGGYGDGEPGARGTWLHGSPPGKGWRHATAGCDRTTNHAIKEIERLYRFHPHGNYLTHHNGFVMPGLY